jgi:hypothetical protein
MVSEQHELDEILAGADKDVAEVVAAYEPLEALYREAYSSTEVFRAASNTTMMPRAVVAAFTTTG